MTPHAQLVAAAKAVCDIFHVGDNICPVIRELKSAVTDCEATGAGDRRRPADGMVWAKRFCEYARLKPEIAIDEGTMVGWFANAIMSEYDGADYLPPAPPAVARGN